ASADDAGVDRRLRFRIVGIAGSPLTLLEGEQRVAGERLDADLPVAVAVARLEALAGAELLLAHGDTRRIEVAAEALAAHARRKRLGQAQVDVAADGLGADLAAVGQAHAHLGIARHRSRGQAPDPLAAAVDADVARHRLRMYFAI